MSVCYDALLIFSKQAAIYDYLEENQLKIRGNQGYSFLIQASTPKLDWISFFASLAFCPVK